MAESKGAIGAFDQTVAAAGTAVAIHASQPVSALVLRAKVANTTNIFVGGADVDYTAPPNAGLEPGLSMFMAAEPGQKLNIGNIYIDTATNDDGVDCWFVP